MTKRAILYARVSRDDTRQEGRNLDGQIQMGQEYANKQGYLIVAELKEDDKGASGVDINLPKLNEVRTMARNGQFDVLIVREIDRLSRSLAKQLIVEQELKQEGVEIEYVLGDYPDTPEGNFMRHMRATIAEYEREKIIERANRGRYNKVKAGSVFVSGNAPYGYHLVQEGSHHSLEINELEARIVRMIFEWYLSGITPRKIEKRLNDMEVPTYTDTRPHAATKFNRKREPGRWSRGTVRHLLMNETYTGTWYYGKHIGRNGTKHRPKEEQIAVSVPAIISKETWDAAEQVRRNNRSERKHSESYDYLLKGHIFCKHCGHRMGARTAHVDGKVYAYYRCNAYRNELAEECPYSTIYYQAERVDQIVWEWISSILTDPQRLHQGLVTYQLEKEQNVAPVRERLHLVEEMLTEEQTKLTRLLELYLSGEFPKEMLTERKNRLEAKIKALENEALELKAALAEQTVSQEQIEMVRQFGETITGELETADENMEAIRYVLNILAVQTWLWTEGENRYVTIQCAIGGQKDLSLTHTTTNGCWRQRAPLLSMCGQRCNT